ncbi:MAG: type II toxin-antitoxin system ParD family antitoxin [Methylomonas sp.]|jgi:antitoxin ParD1/3/4
MPMQRKTITLTDQMEVWVRAQVDSGKYGNDSEYFRDLIRQDQDRQTAELELGNLLDDAEASGTSERSLLEIWRDVESLHTRMNG